jgi:hypothetical protein
MRQKTSLFCLFLMANSMAIHAQFAKGDKMAGASIASIFFNSGNTDISTASIGDVTSKITSYGVSITPQIGWFVSDKIAIGATLNINPNGQKTTYQENGSTYQSDKSNGFNIGFGGFLRSYFSGKAAWMPFGQASLNGGISNLKTDGFFYYKGGVPYYKYTYSGNSSGGSFVNAALDLGLTKMFGDNAGLDLFIGYNFAYNKTTFKRTTLYYLSASDMNPSTGKNETTNKFTNHGFVLGLGFQVFLRGKKK